MCHNTTADKKPIAGKKRLPQVYTRIHVILIAGNTFYSGRELIINPSREGVDGFF